jgi:hypothetical protein
MRERQPRSAHLPVTTHFDRVSWMHRGEASDAIGGLTMSCARRALDDTFPFISICPQCFHERRQLLYSYRVLGGFLKDDNPIEAYCPGCERFWTLSAQERAALTRLLTVRAAVNATSARLH